METTEFSSNKFKIFCLSKLARQRNWDSRPDTWQQPQEQMALPLCVEGKRFRVKHTKHFQLCRRLMGSPCPFQAWEAQWMEILSMKKETPSWGQAQPGDTAWWHKCSAQTHAHTSAQGSLAGPTQSAQHCLIYSLDCTEDSSSFGRALVILLPTLAQIPIIWEESNTWFAFSTYIRNA